MDKVYIFLADGVEEIEALTVVDLLRRVGIDITLISIEENVDIYGSHGIVFSADKVFDEVSFEDVDMLILPGGTQGAKKLGKHVELMDKVKEFDKEGKMIAAICFAPTVLAAHDLLRGRRATCYPALSENLTGGLYEESSVVVDGNLITSRGLGTSIDFALAIIEHFKGISVAEELK